MKRHGQIERGPRRSMPRYVTRAMSHRKRAARRTTVRHNQCRKSTRQTRPEGTHTREHVRGMNYHGTAFRNACQPTISRTAL